MPGRVPRHAENTEWQRLILLPLRLPMVFDGSEAPVLLGERTQFRGAVDVIPDGLRLRHFIVAVWRGRFGCGVA